MTPSPSGRLAYAPGRVNLIGDHTDYNDGLALPMAIDLGVEVTYHPAPSTSLVIGTELDSAPAEIPTTPGAPGGPLPPWARLAKAIVDEAGWVGGGRVRVRSNLPAGAGLASSAAFGVALCLALGVELEPVALARLCQRAELAIGVPVGIMDPLVSLTAVARHALFINFATVTTKPVVLPEEAEFVVVDSGAPRTLDRSPYANRRSECEAAAALVGTALGLASPADLDRIADPLLRRRASHVISEVARVSGFAEAMSSGDLTAAGRLMIASHRSLADDFDASTPELDRLVAALCSRGDVYGARLTGAGFGGCVVALCRPGAELPLSNRLWRVSAAGPARAQTL